MNNYRPATYKLRVCKGCRQLLAGTAAVGGVNHTHEKIITPHQGTMVEEGDLEPVFYREMMHLGHPLYCAGCGEKVGLRLTINASGGTHIRSTEILIKDKIE